MGVILHRRHASLLLCLAIGALTATPASAQAPADPAQTAEPPVAADPVGSAENVASGLLGGVGATLQEPPAPVSGVVEALPPVVGGTVDGLAQALGSTAQSGPLGPGLGGAPAPPTPPTEPPASPGPDPTGVDPPGGEGGSPNDSAIADVSTRVRTGRRGDGGDQAGADQIAGRVSDHPRDPADGAATVASIAGGGGPSGEGAVVELPAPAESGNRGAFERIVAVVPWPVYAALALMTALLALSTARSRRYRRRLAEAEHLAKTDGLTGLPNRQDAELFLERLAAASTRSGRPLAVALIDLDHFKAINDDFGHAAGDATLRGVGHALRSELRTADHVGRHGGEEFLAILPDTGVEEALFVAERIRERIAAMPRRVDRPVTASIGVATLPGDAGSVGELVAAADRALYAAKEAGRDQVVWAGALEPSAREGQRRAAVTN